METPKETEQASQKSESLILPSQLAGAKQEHHGRLYPLSRLFPNIVTIMGLCAGLSSIRFALSERWEHAVIALLIAAVIDGLDGRIARLLKASSTFGAQLDSLSDFLSFGVAPALVMYIWSLHDVRGLGWAAALFFAVCCAIRLARFNTGLTEDTARPKSERFFYGIPAPAGGLLALMPMMLHFETGNGIFDIAWLNIFYVTAIAGLMASRIPTFSFKKLGIQHDMVIYVMPGAGLVIAMLIIEPWIALPVIGIAYLATFPLSFRAYQRYSASE